jgi:Tol biopolymer transport system component
MRIAVATTTLVGVLLLAGSTLAGGGTKTKVESKASNGAIASGDSQLGEVSPNGRYMTFSSTAPNLPGTAGGTIEQVFLRDRKTGKVKLVSKTTPGVAADDTSEDSSVSANGRRVVFESEASNLPGGALGDDQVYVRDLKTKRTKLVSRTSDGVPANSESFDGSIAAGGRFVVFESEATNLPGGLTGDQQVYLHDLKRGRTQRLARTSAGDPTNGTDDNASISAKGRTAVFESNADNLPGTGLGTYQVFVRDLVKGKTRLVSKTSAGVTGDGDSFDPLLSDNGRFVGFGSAAENLPGGGTIFWHAYLHDRKTGKTTLVSRTSSGDPASNGDSLNPYPSNNGRFVVFESEADNLPGGDFQVYLRDHKRGKTTLISRNNGGEAADEFGDIPRNRVLVANDRLAFFDAAGTNMPGLDNQVFSRGPLP